MVHFATYPFKIPHTKTFKSEQKLEERCEPGGTKWALKKIIT